MTDGVKINRGLKGIYFERSGVSHIDGAKGELSYRGYSIHDLATQSSFEEVCYLLINGELPTAAELAGFDARLKAARRKALDAVDHGYFRHRLGWSAGGFATAAVAVLAVVLWTGNGGGPVPSLSADDWELLAEGDLQLIEDLEFYDWLPEEETAG